MGIFRRRLPALNFEEAFAVYHEFCVTLADAVVVLIDERGQEYGEVTYEWALQATRRNWEKNNPTGWPIVEHAEGRLDEEMPDAVLAMWEMTFEHVEQGGGSDDLNLISRAVLGRVRSYSRS
ncbi:hypothetical protein [Modestobacter sp. SSW1-42]|uniref:hypothetical protein n=1 Tax=Modestobacter sp. SSW1-42 TaxID=596372 RepID=UPI003987BEAE